MWLDKDGGVHLVFQLDWSQTLSFADDAAERILSAPSGERELFQAHIDDLETAWVSEYEAGALSIGNESQYAEKLPPVLQVPPIASGAPLAAFEGLVSVVMGQPLRWRLDYIQALRHLVDAAG